MRKRFFCFLVVSTIVFSTGCFFRGDKNVKDEFKSASTTEETTTRKNTEAVTTMATQAVTTTQTTTVTTEVTTTEETTVEETTVVTEPEPEETEGRSVEEGQIQELPESVLEMVKAKEWEYPGMKIGVGIYSLDKSEQYEYNPSSIISSGCTVKAAFALFVLKECEKQGIDIYNYYLEYREGMRNGGSGTIQDAEYGTTYSIDELLTLLLGISDNTAYNILLSEFPLDAFQEFLNQIGGQQLNGARFGATNVTARKNEWFAIMDYINSNSQYSSALHGYITGTNYCYLAQGMEYEHEFMHKSGWAYGGSYTCACDCGVFDNRYIVVVLTDDYQTMDSHINVVSSIGWAVEYDLLN